MPISHDTGIKKRPQHNTGAHRAILNEKEQKKRGSSKDIQLVTSTATCFSNETYTMIFSDVALAAILRLPPNLKLLT